MAEPPPPVDPAPVVRHEPPHERVPRRMFAVQLLYLAALIFVFLLYETSSGFRDDLPDSLGPLPIEVPWFGALGGSLISFAGIFRYSCDWDDCYRYWHYSRPLIGAVIGSVGALVFFLLADTANQDGTVELNATAFDVVAFLVGYREESFRELIKSATDLLLRPPATAPPAEGAAGAAPPVVPPSRRP